MTTIAEMDEFFDFDTAANHHLSHTDFPSGPYDIDLSFAENENENENANVNENVNGDDVCISPQHMRFGDITPEQLLSLQIHHAATNFPCATFHDTTMMGPEDFTDFPRWIEGMDIPDRPCQHCEETRTHCKLLNEGLEGVRGSCTSCVALNRSCSLISLDEAANGFQKSQGICIPSSDAVNETMETAQFKTAELVDPHAWDNITSSMEEMHEVYRNSSAPNLKILNPSTENLNAEEANPKVGARFSRESVRILKNWLTSHHQHPYPTDEEKESLKNLTGLNKIQIVNWLANARRRGKVRAPRSVSPSPRQFSNAIDIPRRSGTPALREMNPLERWKNSPPENEPASIISIAKAVSSSTFSSGHESPYSYGHTDDGSARSLFNASSASSLGTSHSSGGSFASAFSHKSRGSFGSFNSFGGGNRGRRRRRRAAPKPVKTNVVPGPPKTFQCTFCTETFKTKHDWQRHEKSLHLSLERWICAPHGHSQFNAECNGPACIYCGIPNPSDTHAEQHNHSSCIERTLEERTFYRKDHLRQHLNLVHDAKFQAWSMDSWRVTTPEIRSRCGFCGIIMDSWSVRVDHLAEHFKAGKRYELLYFSLHAKSGATVLSRGVQTCPLLSRLYSRTFLGKSY
jgi:hypothetical protein